MASRGIQGMGLGLEKKAIFNVLKNDCFNKDVRLLNTLCYFILFHVIRNAILLGVFTCTHSQIHNTNATYFGINASEGWVIFVHFKIDFRGSDRESPTSYSDRGNKLGRGAQNNRAYKKETKFYFHRGK